MQYKLAEFPGQNRYKYALRRLISSPSPELCMLEQTLICNNKQESCLNAKLKGEAEETRGGRRGQTNRKAIRSPAPLRRYTIMGTIGVYVEKHGTRY